MSTQLERWQGEFGADYTRRNVVDWRTRVDTFRRLIPADVNDALECGANKGHNLQALASLGLIVRGVEPSEFARGIAVTDGLPVSAGDIYAVPYGDAEFDLSFTSGVLIHVPPDRLDDALAEMARVSRRYVLAIEYAGDDEAVDYRGHADMLWRRDYGAHYRRVCPELRLRESGELTIAEGFDRATFWLMEKP